MLVIVIDQQQRRLTNLDSLMGVEYINDTNDDNLLGEQRQVFRCENHLSTSASQPAVY